MTDKKEAFGAAPISASDLRRRMAERELEDAKKAMAKRKQMEEEQEEFRRYFMSSEVTEQDRQRIRQRAMRIADQG